MGLSRWERFKSNPSVLVLRHRDFRLLWFGAFLSFMGTWVQNVAQGWLVYDITGERTKLAIVTFVGMAPMAVLAPFAGALTDRWNRRVTLVVCQSVYAVNALFLAAATHGNWVRYEYILGVAALNGFASVVEVPTRQSLVSEVVPLDEIPAAVPLQGLTFNGSRLLGPSIGGELLARFGPESCYLINGISYLALISAVIAIRADISARLAKEPQPMVDLIKEGMLYTWRDKTLKTLFLMEVTTSVFAMFYIPLMPALIKDVLQGGERTLGTAMTSIGVGAVCGLITVSAIAHLGNRRKLLLGAMGGLSLGLLGLSFARSLLVAAPFLALMGFSAVMQFNTTNTLFQMLAPANLRGRVLSMHIWAISGFGPITIPLFGLLADKLGLSAALQIGSFAMLGGFLLAVRSRSRLELP